MVVVGSCDLFVGCWLLLVAMVIVGCLWLLLEVLVAVVIVNVVVIVVVSWFVGWFSWLLLEVVVVGGCC